MSRAVQPAREETYKRALLKAAATIRELLQENAALRKKDSVAVVGMACRFPGGANNPEQFWTLLRDGVDAITDVPPARWAAETYYDADHDAPGKMYTVRGGFLDLPVEAFDASFFGISPREARAMDPQHRLLLEIAWEALEYACIDATRLKDSKTGVFVGMSSDDYAQAHRHSGHAERIDAYSILGSTFSTAVGRLSYTLGLQGPCMALDTACSSSLVALHLACQSLRAGESHLALAGGVNLILSPHLHICFSKLQAISAQGKCRTFDASADGYVRGEGCGMVVLKRLQDALADGDRILAIVRGSAINQDGKTNGLAAPNGNAQQAVIRQALEDAGLEPTEVDYVEAHGTGTVLGDPIEVEALGAVFGEGRQEPLRLGAVKTNIGHLEPAAGIAGFIKIILSLLHEELPSNLHFQRPNPHIAWDGMPLQVVTERAAWRRSARARVAGLSSFGFGGTNAHIIVEEAPPSKARDVTTTAPDSHLLCLSARDENALRTLAAEYLALLSAVPAGGIEIGDVCYSASAGRRHWSQRLAVEGCDNASICEKLESFLRGREQAGLALGNFEEGRSPAVAFLFAGQGSQYTGMGRGLYRSQRVFRQAIDRCDTLLQPLLKASLVELLFTGGAEKQTIYAQPALFALEYALSELWTSWGIRPSALMGHSVGEYVAACVAGVFSLEDGIRLIAERGRLMQALPPGGSMTAVFASAERVAAAIAPHGGRVAVAAFNGPDHTVISGDEAAVQSVSAVLRSEGIRTRDLRVSHAFHSHLMEPMLAAFERVARQVAFSPPRIKLVSNITGKTIGADIATPQYWVNHISQPVGFAAGMKALHDEGIQVFVELGPQSTLLAIGRQCIAEAETEDLTWLPSLRPNAGDQEVIHRALGTLYAKGAAVNWAAVYRDRDCRWLTLPSYPFQRKRFWIDSPELGGPAAPKSPSRPTSALLDHVIGSPALGSLLFEKRFGLAELPMLADHRVFGQVIVSGACLVSMILEAATQAFGAGTIQLSDVVLHQALKIPDKETRLVHLALTRDGKGESPFRLVSVVANSGTEQGTLHVSGTIQIRPRSSEQPPCPLPALMEKWDLLGTEIAGRDVYESLQRRHIEWGPSNQWIEAIRRDPDEAIGRLRLPDTGETRSVAGYQLHPGLIDSCFSLLVAGTAFAAEKTLLPFAIKQFSLRRPARGKRFWAHVRRRTLPDFPDRLIGDIWLTDETGELIAECLGLEGRAATADVLLRSETRDLSDRFYRLQWIDRAPQVSGSPEAAEKNWLIFEDDAGLGRALAERLRARGSSVTSVVQGSGFERVAADAFRIDPRRPDDMALLLQAVFDAGGRRFHVVYLWGLNADAADPSSLEAAIASSCAPILHFVRAIGRIGELPSPSLTLVTRGAQSIWSGTSPQRVAFGQAPLWGLGKSVALEHPELSCKRIDLDPGGTADAATIDSLLRQLLSPDQEDQIAQRGDHRLLARLVRYRPPAPSHPLPVRAEGSYLVCGGLGGIGLLLARELVARGALDVTLCGRKPAGPEAIKIIAELRRSGAAIRVCRADLTCAEDVEALFAAATAERPLKGIVHAAGVLDDGVLDQLDWGRFSRVLAAKTIGLTYLDQNSRHLALDFFIGFSSMVSLTGSLAQGAYVSANTFVDALMHDRRAQGLPALSINWGPWSEVGMAARLEGKQRLRLSRHGVVALSPEDAFRSLDRLCSGALAQVGFMDVNWPEFLHQFPQALDLPLFEELRTVSRGEDETESPVGMPADGTLDEAAPPPVQAAPRAGWIQKLEQTPVSRRRAVLTSLLREEIGRLLESEDDDHIAPRQRLFDLGMDSLMAVELHNRLASALGCSFPTTLLFDYPTLEALVDHLSAVIPGMAFEIPAKIEPTPAASFLNAKQAALERLSQTELEDMLAEKLRAMAE